MRWRHTYTNANGHSHGNTDSDSNGYTDRDSNGYTDASSYANSECAASADARTQRDASGHAAASTIRGCALTSRFAGTREFRECLRAIQMDRAFACHARARPRITKVLLF
jgi:hypothetical protein